MGHNEKSVTTIRVVSGAPEGARRCYQLERRLTELGLRDTKGLSQEASLAQLSVTNSFQISIF
jgi:hypothetical protein